MHMKLFVGAKGFISRPDGKVLIVREGRGYQEGTELGNWDVVGGRINNEELLLDGLHREIEEESGLQVSVNELIGITENFPVINGEAVHIIRVYYSCVTLNDTVVLSGDHDAFEWIEPSDYASYAVMDDVAGLFQKYLTII